MFNIWNLRTKNSNQFLPVLGRTDRSRILCIPPFQWWTQPILFCSSEKNVSAHMFWNHTNPEKHTNHITFYKMPCRTSPSTDSWHPKDLPTREVPSSRWSVARAVGGFVLALLWVLISFDAFRNPWERRDCLRNEDRSMLDMTKVGWIKEEIRIAAQLW